MVSQIIKTDLSQEIEDQLNTISDNITALSNHIELNKKVAENPPKGLVNGQRQEQRTYYFPKKVNYISELNLDIDLIEDYLSPVIEHLTNRFDKYNETIDGIESVLDDIALLEDNEKNVDDLTAYEQHKLAQTDSQLTKLSKEIQFFEYADLYDAQKEPDSMPPVVLEYKLADKTLKTGLKEHSDYKPSGYFFPTYISIALIIFGIDEVVNYLIFRNLIGLEVDFSMGLAVGIAAAFSIWAHIFGKWFKKGAKLKYKSDDNTGGIKKKLSFAMGFRKAAYVVFAIYLLFLGVIFLVLPRLDVFWTQFPGQQTLQSVDPVEQAARGNIENRNTDENLKTSYGLFLMFATFAIAGLAAINASIYHDAFSDRKILTKRLENARKVLDARLQDLIERRNTLEYERHQLINNTLSRKHLVQTYERKLHALSSRLSQKYSLKNDSIVAAEKLNITLNNTRLKSYINLTGTRANEPFTIIRIKMNEQGKYTLKETSLTDTQICISPDNIVDMVKDFKVLHALTIPLLTCSGESRRHEPEI